jgi:aspartyl-tRNA(Asn)/glutamyl-tRNA(Gln) amidotransferase subunit C
LSFSDEELLRLCVEVRSVRQLLSRVSKFKDASIQPLYNVWDETLDPPHRVDEGDRGISLSWLPEDRVSEGRVRVPWRGG